MGLWSIVLPDVSDTINYAINPSIETDTTGWETVGTGITLSQCTTDSFIGHACLKMASTTSATSDSGCLLRNIPYPIGADVGYSYTISMWVKAPNPNHSMRFALCTTDLTSSIYTDFYGTSDWQKITVSGTDTVNATNIAVLYNDAPITAATEVYIDGVMFTTNDRETIYIDGDQEDCYWVGQRGLSQSYRKENSRSGGQIYNIEDDLAVYVNSYTGIGQPTATHLTLSQPLIPGALYQGRKIEPRVITIEADFSGSSLESMHNLRKTLSQYINPDLVGSAEVMLRYSGAGNTMYCRAVYDSGLEFYKPTGFDEVAPIRFICYDPFFYDDGFSACKLVGNASLPGSDNGFNDIVRNVNGQWEHLLTVNTTTEDGPNNGYSIFDSAVNKYNEIWYGGAFTLFNDTTSGAHLGYYSSVNKTWVAGGLNLLGAGDKVNALCCASDGKMYIGGFFDTGRTGDSDFRHIGYLSDYSPTRTYNHMATGLNYTVNEITEATDGTIYIGGLTNMYATSDCQGLAAWNGTSFYAPTTSVFSAISVNAICEGKDRKIYIGGESIVSSDVAGKTSFAIFNPQTALFESAVSDTDTSIIYTIVSGPDGSIYVGGDFTTDELGASGAKAVARWNGTRFEPLGSNPGLDYVRSLSFDENGNLWALGYGTKYPFYEPFLDGISMWNGYVWTHPDVSAVADNLSAGGMFLINGVKHMRFGSTGDNTQISTVTTAVNSGQALAYPVFTCINSTTDNHRLLYLQNNTTNKTIYLDYSIKPNEEVKISFVPGEKYATSSVFGNIWQAVLKGSDIGDFYLRPGDNRIVFFADTTGSTTLNAYLEWRNIYLSADEGA